MTAAIIDVGDLGEQLGKHPDLLGEVSELEELLERSVEAVRRICSNLRPRVLDDLGVLEALQWLCDGFQRQHGIRCHRQLSAKELVFTEEQKVAVFRIAQECLNNIARHAHATRVEVELNVSDRCIHLAVRDDGVGITSEQRKGADSYGLIGMRERARALGGKLSIRPSTPTGTTVTVVVPKNTEGETG